MRTRGFAFLRFIFVMLLLSVIAAYAAFHYLEHFWFEQTVSFDQKAIVEIVGGDSTSIAIEKLFSESKSSHDANLQKLAVRFFERDSTIKIGEYALSGTYTRDRALGVLQSGEALQRRVTLIDGYTLKQIFNAVSAPGSDFSSAFPDYSELQTVLKASLSAEAKALMGGSTTLEGWYYPDTYFYTKGAALEDILQRAHQKMLGILLSEWDQREKNLPLASPYEALILASIVERESGHVDERKEIAGVFIRRLQIGMRLQTDPTVIYGMGDRYKGNIRRSDLQRDTPYNTYTRDGLPPAPIANPGRESIHAVLHPAAGKALYFVAKGDGSHAFSETLEEHNKAVRRYQILQRRADYQSAPKDSG